MGRWIGVDQSAAHPAWAKALSVGNTTCLTWLVWPPSRLTARFDLKVFFQRGFSLIQDQDALLRALRF